MGGGGGGGDWVTTGSPLRTCGRGKNITSPADPPLFIFFSWCFTSREATYGLLRAADGARVGGGGGGGGNGGGGELVPALRPAKTEETISHRQNNNVKEMGTPPVRRNLCTTLITLSTAVGNNVTKTASEKQLLRSPLPIDSSRVWPSRMNGI